MFKWLNLAKRLSDIEDMLLTFAKRQDELELDYAELRARCKRLLDRTEKAAKRVVESESEVAPEEGAEDGSLTAAGPPRFLTAKQRLIQQQILRRRAGYQ